jgi:hypothetical protein
MKIKLLIILTTVGIAFAGCNSNTKVENMEDSAVIDSVLPLDSVVVDTTPIVDTALTDTL